MNAPESHQPRSPRGRLTALRISCGVTTPQLLDADRLTTLTSLTSQRPSLATESRRLLHALVRRPRLLIYNAIDYDLNVGSVLNELPPALDILLNERTDFARPVLVNHTAIRIRGKTY